MADIKALSKQQDLLKIRVGLIGLKYFNNKEILKIEIQNFLFHKDSKLIKTKLIRLLSHFDFHKKH